MKGKSTEITLLAVLSECKLGTTVQPAAAASRNRFYVAVP